MIELEHDLSLSLEWWTPNPYFEDEAEVDCEETAKNLTKLGYQKILWHDVKKELPERDKYVLGYCTSEYNPFAVVRCVNGKWDYVSWYDDNENCYIVDYWAELPKINLITKE